MGGEPIKELNSGLVAFKDELIADALAAKRVEVAVVGFGPVRVISDFLNPDSFIAPCLQAEGDTPVGAAIARALDMLDERKKSYRAAGISYCALPDCLEHQTESSQDLGIINKGGGQALNDLVPSKFAHQVSQNAPDGLFKVLLELELWCLSLPLRRPGQKKGKVKTGTFSI
jgi:hypothetical protein